jgi:excisionase family DNA binding protein
VTSALLTITETQDALRVSKATVLELVKSGELSSLKIRRRRLIVRETVEIYITEQITRELARSSPEKARPLAANEGSAVLSHQRDATSVTDDADTSTPATGRVRRVVDAIGG